MHDAGVIDPKTRALPLQMEIDNPGEQLLVGQVGQRGALHARTQHVYLPCRMRPC